MYLGRVICVGQTHDGYLTMFYRLASQSKPGRKIEGDNHRELRVIAKVGYEDKVYCDPFLYYPVMKRQPNFIVLGNHRHTGSVASELRDNPDPMRSIGRVLADWGPEEDGQDTPRLAAAVLTEASTVCIGIVGRAGMDVKYLEPRPGGWLTVATEYREQPYVRESFQPIKKDELEAFAKGVDQSTMSTIIATKPLRSTRWEVEVHNY